MAQKSKRVSLFSFFYLRSRLSIDQYIVMRYTSLVTEKSATLPDDFESVLADLANFRYRLRKFVRFSESAAREAGVTPQQHQLMLGIAGFTTTGQATVSQLAEFLQERHHSVVGLIDRAVLSGLVRRETTPRETAPKDRRVVLVSLTPKGRAVLKRLSLEHREEVNNLREELFRFAAQNHTQSGKRNP
jgi:DNA-binding MarR family transcriptional regulator